MSYDYQVQSLSGKFASNIFLFYDDYADVRAKLVFDTAARWNSGYLSGGATVVGDQLTNSWSDLDGQYVDGCWQFSYYFPPEAHTLTGVRISVEGEGATADLSIDGGETFAPVDELDLTDGLDIVLRVNLFGSDTQAVVSRVTLTFYDSLAIKGTNSNVPVTLTAGTIVEENAYDPAAFANGVTGVITIPADPDVDYLGVEFTVSPDSATTTASVLSLTPTTLYVNGEAVSSPAALPADEWAHIIAAFPANSTGFTVGSAGATVGYLAIYNQAITADQVSAIYNWWAGTSAIRVTDPETITVSESDPAWQLYADSWSAPRLSG